MLGTAASGTRMPAVLADEASKPLVDVPTDIMHVRARAAYNYTPSAPRARHKPIIDYYTITDYIKTSTIM